jgi:integrase
MRKPKPFFRNFTNTWYVQIGKQQINLGPDEEAAWNRYHQLMLGQGDEGDSTAVVVLIDQFLDWCKRNRAPASYDFYFRFLNSFAQAIGRRLQVQQLKPFHVTSWTTEAYPDGSATTIHHAIKCVQRAMNWAVREGYIKSSPVAHMQQPTRTHREVALTIEQWLAVYAAASDDSFRDLLTILHETGCRPQEVRVVEAAHFEPQFKRWVLPRELSKGKRHNRIVYLNPTAFALTNRLASLNPSGPIFRNRHGRPWDKNSINCRFRRLQRRLKISGLCAYVLRHTFATHSLINGVDAQTVAELMGHADTTMLSRVYQHLRANPTYLANAATLASNFSSPSELSMTSNCSD